MWDRRPKIRWQKSQGNGNTQSERLSGWLFALYILYAAALSMLSVYAAIRMAEDCFGVFGDARWPTCLWVAALEISVILVWNEAMYTAKKPGLRHIGNLVMLLAALTGYWQYYREQAETLLEGIQGLGRRYLDAWNTYFVISHHAEQISRTSAAQQQMTWGLLLAVSAVLLQFCCAILRKRTVMLVLPTAVLTAEMTVGLTPQWRGLSCMFAAGILSLYLDCHREFCTAPALVLAGLLAVLLPLTALVMKTPALWVNQAHDGLQAFQHQVEQDIREYDWQALLLLRRDGQVDNHRPEYEKKEVLTVTVSERPGQNIYLRGYYGAGYHRGTWSTAENEFNWACRRYGIGSGEAAGLLAELNSPAGSCASVDRVRYELQYTGLRSRSAYLPYGADLETASSQYWVRGDYVVEKSQGQAHFAFEGFSPGSLVTNGSELWNSDVQKFYSWYNEYAVEQYLVVSDDLLALTDIVDDIKVSDACRIILERSQEDAGGRNAARLALGSLVAGELRGLARYNIDPGPLPAGMDPVEYFLGENRQGYCMHFASAGVLILRQLGVPARFVSGYVVQPDRFRQSAEGYQASVRDDDAHAWAEVWLEDVGWIPIEMTPGYEETEIVLAERGQQSLITSSKQPTVDSEEQKPETPTIGSAEREPESPPVPTAMPQNQPPENGAQQGMGTRGQLPTAAGTGVSDSPGAQEESEGWGFAGEGGWAVFGQSGSLRVSHVVLGVLGTAAAVMGWLAISWLLHRRIVWWQTIRSDIEKGATRRVVRVLNRRLYKRLRRKRAGILILGSDEEYLAALKRQYPQEDWESYLAVVRKAVYSQEEISAEEAKACYARLRRMG